MGNQAILAQEPFWQLICQPDTFKIFDIEVNASEELIIAIGDSYQGTGELFKSDDFGNSWEYILDLPDGQSCLCVEISDEGCMYAGSNQGLIYKSEDNGADWQLVYDGWKGIHTIATGYDSIVLAGSSKQTAILRSADYGESWDTVHTFIGTPHNAEWFTDFQFSNPDTIYASMRPVYGDTGVYISTDLGKSWEPFGLNEYVYSLGLTQYGKLLAGVYANGIYRYEGTYWNQLYDIISPEDIVVSKMNYIYLACGPFPNFIGGAMVSYDDGNSFEWINSGIGDDRYLNEFAVDNDGYLYASNDGWSQIFRSTAPIITNVDQHIRDSLSSCIYPNPAREKFKIHCRGNENPQHDHPVTGIEIYNLLGEKTRSISVPKDRTIIEIDASGWQSGMYVVCLLSNGRVVESDKIVIK